MSLCSWDPLSPSIQEKLPAPEVVDVKVKVVNPDIMETLALFPEDVAPLPNQDHVTWCSTGSFHN